jgi:hypothetical protein
MFLLVIWKKTPWGFPHFRANPQAFPRVAEPSLKKYPSDPTITVVRSNNYGGAKDVQNLLHLKTRIIMSFWGRSNITDMFGTLKPKKLSLLGALRPSSPGARVMGSSGAV